MRRVILFLTLAVFSIAQADTVKVGVLLPLSGEYDFVGKAVMDGFQMTLDEWKGKTKHTYQVIYEDTIFQPGRTSLAAQKLLNIDKVDIIVTIFGPEAMATAPLAESKKIPHMAGDWDLLWTQKYKYTFNLSQPCDDYANLELKMFKRWGCHRVALIWQNSADWVYAMPYMTKAFTSDPSITLVANERFNSPVRDFRTMLAKINETKPDLIVVDSILPESEIILRQARELGINCIITGYYEDLSEKKLGEGMSFICFTNPDGEWIGKYRSRYGHDPAYSTNWGYDQMTTIIKAFESFEHKPTGIKVTNSVPKIRPWVGASGLLIPRADRMIDAPLKVVKYHDGKMVADPNFADLNKAMGW